MPRARIELARTGKGPRDFKSLASTNSATVATSIERQFYQGPKRVVKELLAKVKKY